MLGNVLIDEFIEGSNASCKYYGNLAGHCCLFSMKTNCKKIEIVESK